MREVRYAQPMHHRRRLAAIPVLTLLLLGIVLTTAASTPPPPLPDWGTPPGQENDWPEIMPELPQGAGWARHIGAEAYEHSLLGIGQGLLFTSVPDGLQALRLSDGAQLWRADLKEAGGLASFQPLALSSGTAYLQLRGTGGAVAALDLDTGRKRWEAEGLDLQAAGSAGAWASRYFERNVRGGLSPAQGTDLLLLDPASGQVRQDFRLGQVYAYGGQADPDGNSFAVATPQDFVLCHADGTVQRIARTHAGWDAQLAADGRGLVAVEFPLDAADGEEVFDDTGEHGRTASYLKQLADPATGQVAGDAVVSYYALPEGKLQWRRAWFDYFVRYKEFGEKALSLAGDYAVYASDPGLRVMRRSDGVSGFEDWSDEETRQGGPQLLAQLPDALLLEGLTGDRSTTAAPQALQLLPLSNLKPQVVALDLGSDRRLFYADGYLCRMVSQHGGWDAELPENSALVCSKVDAELAALPGQPTVLSAPDPRTELIAAFYASAAPLQDATLMRRVAGQGQRGLIRLLEQVQAGDQPHLDALAMDAEYLCRVQGEGRYNYSAAALLLHFLRPLGQPVTPLLVRWLDDPQIAALHPRLEGLLAEIGGPQAGQRLAAQDTARPLPPLSRPVAPYQISRPVPELLDDYLAGDVKGQYDFNQWAEAQAADGGRYVAFNHEGLCCDRQIYLGIDQNNDGAFEELLPTGLMDICIRYNGLGGAVLVSPKGPLELKLALPQVGIRHHVARFEHDYERDYDRFVDSDHPLDTLPLTDLRRDTDGDGLTDIAERLLFLDPARTDSDGDGVPDAVDPTPNVNSALMGPVERGVARALDYFYKQSDYRAADPDRASFPFSALYFSVGGCGPVAFSRGGEYGICLSTKEDMEAFGKLAPGYPDFSLGNVTVMPPLTKAGQGYFIYGEEHLAIQASTTGVEQEPGITIDFPGVGYFIELAEINGEYYPVRSRMTWIS